MKITFKLWHFALIIFLMALARVVWVAPGIYDRHSRENREALLKWGTEQAALTRKEVLDRLDARLGSIEHHAVAELRQTRKEARAELAATRDRLDERLDLIQFDASEQLNAVQEIGAERLGETNEIVREQLAAANAAVAGVSAPTAKLVEQINEAAPLWLDCDHNADCAFNRYVGTARGIEQLAVAVGKNAPAQQAALTGIAQDIHTATHEFVRPRRWYEKAWSAIKVATNGVALAVR